MKKYKKRIKKKIEELNSNKENRYRNNTRKHVQSRKDNANGTH